MPLRLIGLTRRFGAQTALDDVSLHVRTGDCYGFLGHNGAGKTTAMRIALGLERADAGRVIVDGFDAAQFPREARARMGGLVETPGFHGHLDGVANLATLAKLQGFARAGAKREAERLVEAVGLVGAGRKRVRDYSQGMRQRLGVAQALLGSPKYVLLDEPMNGLDPEGIEEIRRLLRRLTRDEGTTVLLSSHQLGEIAGLCNRIGILRQGRLLVEEETSTLLAAEANRYALATADDAAAARVLAASGVEAKPRGAGGLDVALGARRPADVARGLVAQGVELRAWTPRPPSLEEIYLGYTQGGVAPKPAETADVVVAAPKERRAPPRPVARVFAYDLRRLLSTAAAPVLLAAPALVAVGAVWSRHRDAVRDEQEIAAGTLASATRVTGFQGVATALHWAFPLLALVVVGLASQTFAAEDARGTLRNVLLRPVTRVGVAAGKAICMVFAAVVAFALLKAATMAAAGHWLSFGDVVDILPNGEPYVMPGGAADAVDHEMLRTFLLLLPVLAAFAGLGLLAGAATRSGAAALATALGGVLLLVVLRVPGQAFGFEAWLPTAHLPVPELRDTSVVGYFALAAEAASDRQDRFADFHVVVPLAWAAATFGAAAMILRRRSIR